MKFVRLKRFPISARKAALTILLGQKARLDERIKKAGDELEAINTRIANGPARKHEERRRVKKEEEIQRIREDIAKKEGSILAVGSGRPAKRPLKTRRML